MTKENIIVWGSIVIAGLFVYGKYFVANTALEKVDYGITAMLFLLLGLIINSSIKNQENFEQIVIQLNKK